MRTHECLSKDWYNTNDICMYTLALLLLYTGGSIASEAVDIGNDY